MKKTIFKGTIAAAALTLITIASTFAQNKDNGHATRLGAALSIGVPTNSIGGDFVLAPDLRLQHDLSQRTSLTLTTGYYAFLGRDDVPGTNDKVGTDIIPLKAGAKFFFGESYYFQPELGVGFGTAKNAGTAFIYAPSLGYANNKFDVSLRYEGFENDLLSTGMVAVRFAYAFKRPRK